MVESNHSGFSVGRDYLAALELLLMLQRVGNKFVKLLRSQELIQDHTLRASDLGRISKHPRCRPSQGGSVVRPAARARTQWPETVLAGGVRSAVAVPSGLEACGVAVAAACGGCGAWCRWLQGSVGGWGAFGGCGATRWRRWPLGVRWLRWRVTCTVAASSGLLGSAAEASPSWPRSVPQCCYPTAQRRVGLPFHPPSALWLRLQPIESRSRCVETALEFCRRLVSNSRSCGLRIRSSCINVSEKESRICFAVIRHTPPSVWLNVLVPVGRNGEAAFAETLPPRQAIIQQKDIHRIPAELNKHWQHDNMVSQEDLPARHRAHHGVENLHSVSTAKFRFGSALGMRHHADHVAARAADAGDVVQRTIGIAEAETSPDGSRNETRRGCLDVTHRALPGRRSSSLPYDKWK